MICTRTLSIVLKFSKNPLWGCVIFFKKLIFWFQCHWVLFFIISFPLLAFALFCSLWLLWITLLCYEQSYAHFCFSSGQSLSRVRLSATPWTVACQASLSHHQLPELAETSVHLVGDAIQPSHPLASPSPPVFILSQHQGLSQWVSSSHQVATVLEFQLQHQSFQWIFRTDFLYDGVVWSPCCPRDSPESSSTPQFKSLNSLALSFLYSSILTSIHDYWKNYSFDETDLCW